MKKIVFSLLLLPVVFITAAQPVKKDRVSAPAAPLMTSVLVDGLISSAEWAKQAGVKRFRFDLGDCFYKLMRDTLFFAFDITTDAYNDQSADKLVLYADRNKNNLTDDDDIINCTAASFFGSSAFLNTYPHRTWEMAVPLTSLFNQGKTGFSFRIISRIPLLDKIVEYQSGYQLELAINHASAIISYAATGKPLVAATDTSIQLTSQKILANGDYEITYPDGTKKLFYKGGYTTIFPDGRTSQASFMSVSPFAPPAAPNDPDMSRYLQNVSTTLLSLLTDLLHNDTESIENFKKGDANLTIYKIISRRFEFINYITSKK